MSIETILSDLSTNHATYGITLYAPSTTQQINKFETTLGLTLPDTFRQFYLFCNGFESAEDMFRIIPLEEIAERKQDYEPNSFSIAEYMIYCDIWDVHLTPPDYTNYLISNTGIKYRPLLHPSLNFWNALLSVASLEKEDYMNGMHKSIAKAIPDQTLKTSLSTAQTKMPRSFQKRGTN
jgi:hypothetical protein